MEIPAITIIEEADRRKAIVTLLLGFSGDPFVRWLNPRADLYLEAGPSFDALVGGLLIVGQPMWQTNSRELLFGCHLVSNQTRNDL